MVTKSILDKKNKALVKKYRLALASNGIPVEKIILFGSYAKGKAKPWSDLDVCVVSKVFGKDNYAERVMLYQMRDDSQLLIEPHPYNPIDLEDRYDPLAYEIMKTGRVVA